MLCGLFAEVLGLERVGIDDNFFALGGDSIMSIQLVSRARRAGLVITPRAVFQHQTVAALAAVAGVAAQAAALAEAVCRTCDRRVAGDADHALAAGARRAARALQPGDAAAGAGGAAEEHLRAALQALLDHHDALRLRLDAAAGCASGALEIAPPGAVAAADCLRRVDVRAVDDAALRGLHRGGGAAAAGRLAPAAGMMVQAVWFDAGRGAAGVCC